MVIGRYHSLAFMFVLFAAIFLLSGCSKEKLQSKDFYTAFDTISRLQFYSSDEEAEAIFDQFETALIRYHQLFDIYHDYEGINNIKTINDNAGIAPVAVDADVIDMLNLGRRIYEQSGGKANISMGSVLAIWHDYRTAGMDNPENAALPDMEELQAAAMHTNMADLVIDETAGTVYLADEDMSLDVGAVAKGYAVEKLGELLKSWGITKGLIDVGGNILAIGSRADGKDWRLGLQNPDLESDEAYIHVILLNDLSIVTSGDYQRYYTVDGERYHHIIDAGTLMPADYFTAVSVIAADSGLADALSTALFSMDEPSGRRMIAAMDDVEVLWVYSDGHESMTEGFEDYIE